MLHSKSRDRINLPLKGGTTSFPDDISAKRTPFLQPIFRSQHVPCMPPVVMTTGALFTIMSQYVNSTGFLRGTSCIIRNSEPCMLRLEQTKSASIRKRNLGKQLTFGPTILSVSHSRETTCCLSNWPLSFRPTRTLLPDQAFASGAVRFNACPTPPPVRPTSIHQPLSIPKPTASTEWPTRTARATGKARLWFCCSATSRLPSAVRRHDARHRSPL